MLNRLNITIDGRVFQAEQSTNLLRFLRGQGFAISASCNGSGTCGKCAVELDGETQLACEVTLTRDCAVKLPVRRQMQITDDYLPAPERAEPRAGFGLAIDLGTTTVAMELIDLSSGESVMKAGFENPQRAFGADVISRISASKEHANELQRLICEAISAQAEGLLQAVAVQADQVIGVVISGNTTMIYLLLGYDCACLGVHPFEPGTALQNPYAWGILFGGAIACPVFVVPWVSAFVGGDIVSALLHAPKTSAFSPAFLSAFLLVDLGTNGEIALRHASGLLCTATAAGPAFEGMKTNLYGSELLDLTAQMLREGTIDETGLLLEENGPLTQKDIREIQLAKSAVRTGIELLMKLAGQPELDAVYLCGGFGKALNPQSAAEIGLLPEALRTKTIALGNASLGGAAQLLRAPGARQEIEKILAAQTVNLAAQPEFNEYFMEYLGFE